MVERPEQATLKGPLLPSDQQRLVKMFKALGSPVRFALVHYMVEHPQCITGDLVAFAGLAQSTVSQHLKVLRDAGLIVGEIEGAATCYCLDAEALQWFRERVGGLTQELGCCS